MALASREASSPVPVDIVFTAGVGMRDVKAAAVMDRKSPTPCSFISIVSKDVRSSVMVLNVVRWFSVLLHITTKIGGDWLGSSSRR